MICITNMLWGSDLMMFRNVHRIEIHKSDELCQHDSHNGKNGHYFCLVLGPQKA